MTFSCSRWPDCGCPDGAVDSACPGLARISREPADRFLRAIKPIRRKATQKPASEYFPDPAPLEMSCFFDPLDDGEARRWRNAWVTVLILAIVLAAILVALGAVALARLPEIIAHV